MKSFSSRLQSLVDLGGRRHSLPSILTHADQSHAGETGYEADSDSRTSSTPIQTHSAPGTLRDMAISALASDDIAIFLELPMEHPRARIDRASAPQVLSSNNQSVVVPHIEALSPPSIGLGIGLPVEFHIPFRHTPSTTSATAVVANEPTVSQGMHSSNIDRTLAIYSILPPGLSSPIPPSVLEAQADERSSLPALLEDDEEFTIDVILPTPASTHSEMLEYPFDEELVLHIGAPRLRNISRFHSDPLYD